jgi:uncharacterized protein YndB with AHSA1/START domain
MTTSAIAPATSSDNEIVSTRVFNVSRDLMFQAWTNPVHLARWWGPNGFSNTFHTFDPRPDGKWSFVMHGPDGVNYKNESVFREVVKPERIVFDHVSPPRFQVVATFSEEAEGTRVIFRMIFENAEACDRVKAYAVDCNEQNFDRLATELARMREAGGGAGAVSGADRELVITRIIDAPRQRVFKAWTQRFSEWWGPHGMTTPFYEMDLRTGGIFRTVMRAQDGSEYRTKGVFLEVIENERIVFTDAFEPGWQPSPDIFFTAITTFEDVGGKTKYTARALHWTVENRENHEKMGFHHGWGESIDRLAALVTTGRDD